MKPMILDIFNLGWETWQDVTALIAIIFAGLLIIFLIIFLIANFGRKNADEKRLAKQIAWYDEQIALQKQSLEEEKAKNDKELKASREMLAAKEREAAAAEKAATRAQTDLEKKEAEVKKAIEQAEMTKIELAAFQKREKTNVPEDYALNVLTNRVIDSSPLTMRTDLKDIKIPLGKTFEYTVKEVIAYVSKKQNITVEEASGKKPNNYKVAGKTYAMLSDTGEGGFKLVFKCGPSYGSKLIANNNDFVSHSKFPYGLLWFQVDSNKNCSLELIKLLIDISYRIAKLGY